VRLGGILSAWFIASSVPGILCLHARQRFAEKRRKGRAFLAPTGKRGTAGGNNCRAVNVSLRDGVARA
jgi:hypothetical protein